MHAHVYTPTVHLPHTHFLSFTHTTCIMLMLSPSTLFYEFPTPPSIFLSLFFSPLYLFVFSSSPPFSLSNLTTTKTKGIRTGSCPITQTCERRRPTVRREVSGRVIFPCQQEDARRFAIRLGCCR